MASQKYAIEHAAMWAAIDKLGRQTRLSKTALAIRCNLDPGTLSSSKRRDKQGRLRWPSMETVTAVLIVTRTSYGEFGMLVDNIRAAMVQNEWEADPKDERAA